MTVNGAGSFIDASRRTLELLACSISDYLGNHGVELSSVDRRDPAVVLGRLIGFIRLAPESVHDARTRGRIRSLAFEMRDFRNDLMHFQPFDREAQLRFFSTGWRLLDGLGLAAASELRPILELELGAGAGRPSDEDRPVAHSPSEAPTPLDNEIADGRDGFVDQLIADILDEVPMRVDDLVRAMYGVTVRVRGQMTEALWVYQGISDTPCPDCGTLLDVCRLGPHVGDPDHRAWAAVCTECEVARRKQVLPEGVRRSLYQWSLSHPRFLPGVDHD